MDNATVLLLSIFLLLILALVAVLAYLYLRLQLASQASKQQALVIQANEELSHALEQQIILQGEIHHRVKNNLQVIMSLLDLQKDDIRDEKALESLNDMSNRIYSMLAIHEMMYQELGKDKISLSNYLQRLCHHFYSFSEGSCPPVFNIEVPDLYFNQETLMPIGIIVNELLTNSLKYAKQPKQGLVIDVQLEACGEDYCLHYQDNGPGFSQGKLGERIGSLGSYLLKSMVRQLRGHLNTFNKNGAVYQILFKEHIKSQFTASEIEYNRDANRVDWNPFVERGRLAF